MRDDNLRTQLIALVNLWTAKRVINSENKIRIRRSDHLLEVRRNKNKTQIWPLQARVDSP